MSADGLTNALSSQRALDAIYHSEVRKWVAELPRINAGLFARHSTDPVANFLELEPSISTGDLALYSGIAFNSMLIRWTTYSQYSHAGMFYRTGPGAENLYIVDVCLKTGCTMHLAIDAIRSDPDRWYWAHVCRHRYPDFSEKKIVEGIEALLGSKYGRWGILLQTAIRINGIQVVAFALKWDQSEFMLRQPPFCSDGVRRISLHTKIDPSNGRTGSLFTPQDCAQSMLWAKDKVAMRCV